MSISDCNCERLFFEVLERTLRFWSHVESSCAQAARPNRRKTAQETIARTLTTRLAQILESLSQIYNAENISEQERIHILHTGLESLAYLHSSPLSAVPRPYEPIELVSYIRQALNSYPNQKSCYSSPPHVFATEFLGDQAHSRFDQIEDNTFKIKADLTIVKQGDLGMTVEKLLSSNLLKQPFEHAEAISESNNFKDKAIGFISLPRIDLGNPLRWPSLMHELGHFEKTATPETIWEAFSSIEEGRISYQANTCMEKYLTKLEINPSESTDEIQKWLIECWCDAHAAHVAGAPALFSQIHAFLFSTPCYLTEPARGKGYPPAWFRLRLMRALISTRHSQVNPSNTRIYDMISEEWSVMERLFPPSKDADIRNNSNLRNLFDYFLVFLTQQFPQNKWLYQSEINPDDLNELICDLSSGLPIPTHRRFIGDNQTRASHAEILLAGWSFRNTAFKQSLLDIIKKNNIQLKSALLNIINNNDFQLKPPLKQLLAIVDRADASLQMSIQVSEWFGILTQPKVSDVPVMTETNVSLSKGNDTSNENDQRQPAGLLPDNEIVGLLLNNSLRIIPLIGGIKGVEGTVVDIRLGHNFEILFYEY